MRCKGRPFCGVIYTIKERCFLSGVVPQCVVETAQDMLLHYAACAVVGHELFVIISIREEEVEAFVKFLTLDAIVPQACDDFVLKCPQESSDELVRGFRGAIQKGRNTHICVHRGTAEHRLVSCCARSRR
jgi:hypothetical protein